MWYHFYYYPEWSQAPVRLRLVCHFMPIKATAAATIAPPAPPPPAVVILVLFLCVFS